MARPESVGPQIFCKKIKGLGSSMSNCVGRNVGRFVGRARRCPHFRICLVRPDVLSAGLNAIVALKFSVVTWASFMLLYGIFSKLGLFLIQYGIMRYLGFRRTRMLQSLPASN
jgi:hypothetical protein